MGLFYCKMDYQKWMVATSITVMIMTVVGLFAAITYYFSLAKLELRYYFFAYVSLLVIIFFIFFYVWTDRKVMHNE